MTITRELAERLTHELNRVADLVGEHDAAALDGLRGELSAALSAPDKPLTAEECRAFAKRVDEVDGSVLQGERSRLQFTLANFASILDHLEKWHLDHAPAYHNPATPEDATQT